MNESLSGYTPEEHVERPGAAERHKRQAARQASRADSNLTNSKLGCQPLAGSDRWVDALGRSWKMHLKLWPPGIPLATLLLLPESSAKD